MDAKWHKLSSRSSTSTTRWLQYNASCHTTKSPWDLLVLKQCLGIFYESKNDIEYCTRTQGLQFKHCTLAMINAVSGSNVTADRHKGFKFLTNTHHQPLVHIPMVSKSMQIINGNKCRSHTGGSVLLCLFKQVFVPLVLKLEFLHRQLRCTFTPLLWSFFFKYRH